MKKRLQMQKRQTPQREEAQLRQVERALIAERGIVNPQTGEIRNAVNQYGCDTCGRSITTIDRVYGTTPFFLKCRATPDCPGKMYSQVYQVDQTLFPTWEWYKPERGEYKKLSPPMQDHVDMGGLLLRPIAGMTI